MSKIYFTLKLAGLEIPLKLYKSTNEVFKLPIKQGKEHREIRTIKILPTESFSDSYKKNKNLKVKTIEDIERIIPWTSVENYLEGSSGELKSFEEFKGLTELIEQNKEHNKSNNIETLGVFERFKLKWENFNGKQFYTLCGERGQKENSSKNLQLYGAISQYLETSQKYILIRFFTSGQELGALYSESGQLKISGLHATNVFKPVKEQINVIPNQTIATLVSQLLNKHCIEDENPKFVLDWVDFYRESLEQKGVMKKFQKYGIKTKSKSENMLLENELLELLEKM